MDKLNKLWPVILTVAIILIVMMLYQFLRIHLEAPDFASLKDVTERKETFLNYFNRSIQKLNGAITEDREKIEQLASSQSLSGAKRNWLKAIAAQYDVSGDISPAFFERLLSRIDALPPAGNPEENLSPLPWVTTTPGCTVSGDDTTLTCDIGTLEKDPTPEQLESGDEAD